MTRILIAMIAMLTLAAAPALAVEFDHAAHLKVLEGSPCSTCHVEGAKSIKPDTKVCLQCHDQKEVDQYKLPGLKTHGPTWPLTHRPFAKSSDPQYNCAACHQQKDCLQCHKEGHADEMGDFGNQMVNIHTSDFAVTHPIAARTDPQLCASCHENGFCVKCHNSFAPADLSIASHRLGWSNLTVSGAPHSSFSPDSCQTCHPNSVLPAHEWSTQHAREARRDLATCQACHPNGDVCLKCHSATSGLMVNPHPKGWNDIKNRLDNASNGRTCRRCH